MSAVLDRLVAALAQRGLHASPPLSDDELSTLRKDLDGALVPELADLYRTVGPGTTGVFSPVIHCGVVNAWPIWPVATSLSRLRRSTDPLWQLTPAMDIWLDTHEVTILREDDSDESFPHIDLYWANRLEELERSVLEPMTGLWLPPDLVPSRVDAPAQLVDLLLADLQAGREVRLPGLGRFKPHAPPASTSAYNHNVAGPGPSWVPEDLDRLETPDFDAVHDLAARWGCDPTWLSATLKPLHEAVDTQLDDGPVDLMGLFYTLGKHHAARMLPSPDEPVEAPAYREVTGRISKAVALELDHSTP